jgi:hypothetical protein
MSARRILRFSEGGVGVIPDEGQTLEGAIIMGNVTNLPTVHMSFYTNPIVQKMLMLGFSLSDVLEIYGAFFSELANECKDEGPLGEQMTEAQMQQILVRIFDKKLEDSIARQSEELERRAEIYRRISKKKLRRMSGFEWSELARLAG